MLNNTSLTSMLRVIGLDVEKLVSLAQQFRTTLTSQDWYGKKGWVDSVAPFLNIFSLRMALDQPDVTLQIYDGE